MFESQTFGEIIKRQRRVLDLTQTSLASRVGCASVTIKKIEAGVLRPSRQVAELLASALGIPAEHRAGFVRLARSRAEHRPPVDAPCADTLAGSLPVAATALVGRDGDIAAVRQLLTRPEVRLVTLLGPGGVGKTRLALAAAEHAAAIDFPDGVVFVDLVPVREASQVGFAITRALGVPPDVSGDAPGSIVAYLRHKRLVLLIDNMEHVLGAALLLAQIVAAAPGVQVLVTSRVALHLAAEHIYQVPPLATPAAGRPATPAEIAGAPAVQLFAERAQAAQPAFKLTGRNGPVVAALCARLDGLPLAIELAAARIQLYSPAEMLARLADSRGSSDLLQSRRRDAAERQQTLRATLEWSYALLGPTERLLFARLGIFVGGWTLAMAEAVCAGEADGKQFAAQDVCDGLGVLIDHSLVQADETFDGTTRFSMLETIRAYAAEMLEASRAQPAQAARHAACLAALARAAEFELRGHRLQWWFERLNAELGNLRAALAWSLAPGGDVGLGQTIAGSIQNYWIVYGRVEGPAWLDRLIKHPGAAQRPAAYAQALYAASEIAINNGIDLDQAVARATVAQDLFRALGDARRAARATMNLGWAAVRQGKLELAAEVLAQAYEEACRLGDQINQADILATQAELAHAQRDYDCALASYAQARALFASSGDLLLVAGADHMASFAAMYKGDYRLAAALLAECLPIRYQLRDAAGIVYVNLDLGDAQLGLGDAAAAGALYREAQTQAQAHGLDEYAREAEWRLAYVQLKRQAYAEAECEFRAVLRACYDTHELMSVCACLNGLALLSARRGQAELAVRTWAALASVYAHQGVRRWVIAQAASEQAIADARVQLGGEVFEAIWRQGQAISLALLVAESA